MADDKKIIFSMVGVSKVYPPQKQVLKNIYLSFFYGAKIGIIGLNGSGKSSLLKIIAGIDFFACREAENLACCFLPMRREQLKNFMLR